MKLNRSLIALFALSLVSAKDPKPAKIATPAGGVKTPGVLIPAAGLKPDATLDLASPPAGIHFGDAVTIADSSALRRFDAKTNKSFEPSRDVKEVVKACGGLVSAFQHLWTATCGSPALAKVQLPPSRPEGRGRRPDGAKPAGAKPDAAKADAAQPEMTAKADVAAKPEPPKPEAPKPADLKPPAPPKPPVLTALDAAPVAAVAIAASDDSLWLLADAKTSLQRIDPDTNAAVADIRLPAACTSVISAESAIWVACPTVAKLLRIDPRTNLVDKRIDVAAEPVALAAGESSIWVWGRKEGKISRIDPKTNKVTATIDTGLPNTTAALAFGEGALWASAPGFPVMRIAPATDKVVQQFHGEGGGWIAFGAGSVWVAGPGNKIARHDPKRIMATLAE